MIGRQQPFCTCLQAASKCRARAAVLSRHMKDALEGQPNVFAVSLGDLGESKDCNAAWL